MSDTTINGHEPALAEEGVSRRRFVANTIVAAGVLSYGGAITYPIYRYLSTPARRAAELGAISEVAIPIAELPERGAGLMFRFGAKPALLIHHPDGTWSCFDAVCTHLGCTVQFQPEQGRIYCACHGGVYDVKSGANVAGPPPKPLTIYKVEIANEQAIITRA